MAYGSHSTLYAMLLFRALDRFAAAAAEDKDLDGEYNVLDAFVEALDDGKTPASKTYQEEVRALGSKREDMYAHIAAMMRLARSKGVLDQAPLAVGGSEDWLAEP